MIISFDQLDTVSKHFFFRCIIGEFPDGLVVRLSILTTKGLG